MRGPLIELAVLLKLGHIQQPRRELEADIWPLRFPLTAQLFKEDWWCQPT